MEYVDFYGNSAEWVAKTYPSIIRRCDEYMKLHPLSKLWIRDTDHWYSSIRLEGTNVPNNDYNGLGSTCAICGGNIHLSIGDDDFGGVAICDYCRSMKDEKGYNCFLKVLSFLNRIDAEIPEVKTPETVSLDIGTGKMMPIVGGSTQGDEEPNIYALNKIAEAEKFRLRVWTSQKTLLYLTANKVRIDEHGKIYIVHENDKNDIVSFAGIYLHDRDSHGQRMFQGDIVKFSGKAYNGDIISEEGVLCDGYSNRFNDYTVLDNLYDNFPLSPLPGTIEIIGNIFEDADYKVNGGDRAEYYGAYIKGIGR